MSLMNFRKSVQDVPGTAKCVDESITNYGVSNKDSRIRVTDNMADKKMILQSTVIAIEAVILGGILFFLKK
jgi:hypothetical protein